MCITWASNQQAKYDYPQSFYLHGPRNNEWYLQLGHFVSIFFVFCRIFVYTTVLFLQSTEQLNHSQNLKETVVTSCAPKVRLFTMHRVVSDYTRVDDANSNIKVFVRARPVEQEGDLTDFLQTDGDDERKLVIKDPEASNKRYGEVSFQFDKVFWTNTKQEDVFDISCRSQVDHVMNGYNSCCFACKSSRTTLHLLSSDI